jgi:hypothetical protein
MQNRFFFRGNRTLNLALYLPLTPRCFTHPTSV